jgi:uroporphyrinogen-III synthase
LRVLVTRPEDDAEPLVAALAARGIGSVVAPLLAIVPRTDAVLDLEGVQAVLITSANGARALARLTARRDPRLLAVGAASAEAARRAGFAAVMSAEGDVAALAHLADRVLDPHAGDLLHVAAGVVAGDLAGALRRSGFAVRRCVAYDAVPADALPEAARAALSLRTIEAVLLFSPRTAKSFVTLVRAAGLTPALGTVDAVCLSGAVAAEARAVPWRAVRVAARPETDALLDALGGDAPDATG